MSDDKAVFALPAIGFDLLDLCQSLAGADWPGAVIRALLGPGPGAPAP